MGPSIDELKAAAASRVESIKSPSSSSVFQPSSSTLNLNLPREPIRNRINFASSNPLVDSKNFPVASMPGTGSNTVAAQEHLRATAQTINGLIQKDKIQPDLGELLNGNFHLYFIVI